MFRLTSRLQTSGGLSEGLCRCTLDVNDRKTA